MNASEAEPSVLATLRISSDARGEKLIPLVLGENLVTFNSEGLVLDRVGSRIGSSVSDKRVCFIVSVSRNVWIYGSAATEIRLGLRNANALEAFRVASCPSELFLDGVSCVLEVLKSPSSIDPNEASSSAPSSVPKRMSQADVATEDETESDDETASNDVLEAEEGGNTQIKTSTEHLSPSSPGTESKMLKPRSLTPPSATPTTQTQMLLHIRTQMDEGGFSPNPIPNEGSMPPRPVTPLKDSTPVVKRVVAEKSQLLDDVSKKTPKVASPTEVSGVRSAAAAAPSSSSGKKSNTRSFDSPTPNQNASSTTTTSFEGTPSTTTATPEPTQPPPKKRGRVDPSKDLSTNEASSATTSLEGTPLTTAAPEPIQPRPNKRARVEPLPSQEDPAKGLKAFPEKRESTTRGDSKQTKHPDAESSSSSNAARVLFTGYVPSKEDLARIRAMNGVVSEDPLHSTHLIVSLDDHGEIKRTLKTLQILAQHGKDAPHVVTEDWLIHGGSGDPKRHRPKSLIKTLDLRSKATRGVFFGWTLLCEKHQLPEELIQVVKTGDGNFELVDVTVAKMKKLKAPYDKTVLIVKDEKETAKTVWKTARDMGIAVVKLGWIGQSLMRWSASVDKADDLVLVAS